MMHDMGVGRQEAVALRFVAEAHAAAQEFPQALRAAERAKKLTHQWGASHDHAATLFMCAQLQLLVLSASGDVASPEMQQSSFFTAGWGLAVQAANDAVDFTRKMKLTHLLASALCTSAQVQLMKGRVREAGKATHEAMTIFNIAGDELNVARVMCVEANCRLVDGSISRALGLLGKAKAIFERHGDSAGERVATSLLNVATGADAESEADSVELGAQFAEQQYAEEQLLREKEQLILRQLAGNSEEEAWEKWEWQQQEHRQRTDGPDEHGREQVAEDPPQQPPAEQAIVPVAPRGRPLDMGRKLDRNNLEQQVVVQRLHEIVLSTIDVEEDDELHIDTPLMAVGITSKSAVELRNKITDELPGINLPATLVFDYPSINAMSELVVESAQ